MPLRSPLRRRNWAQPLLSIALDAATATPLHRQLYGQLRDAILAGRLRSGSRLPSSRLLQSELGVSRNTVLAAIDQLTAEGYVAAVVGSGTYVAALEPERPSPPASTPRVRIGSAPSPSRLWRA